MDLNDIYGGIISPQGGLYKPQGSDVYSGTIPATPPALKSNSVTTVPINPLTGMPHGVSPPNEVKVPGGTNTGFGYQSGQSFPDSYRLLPSGPLSIAGETPATSAIQSATLPDMRGQPYGFGSRDTQAKQTAGQMFLSAMLGGGAPSSQPYAGGGMLAPEAGDPWAGMLGPRAAAARKPAPSVPPVSSAVMSLANSINSGSKPDTNTIMRTINQSGNESQARDVIGQAMGDQIRKNATPSKTVSGSNNSFMPKSVQNSVRWQTGY